MAYENITGATGASFTTPPLGLVDDGISYRCVVTNPFGSDESNEAVVEVTPAGGEVSGFPVLHAAEVPPNVASHATPSLLPAAGQLVLAKVDTSAALGVAAPLPSLTTANGITWEQVATQVGGGSNRFRTTLFQATPFAPTLGPVTVTYPSAPASNGAITIVQVNTTAGVAALIPATVVQGTASVLTHDLTLPADPAAQASVAGWWKGSGDSAADAYPNWSELADLFVSTRRSQTQGALGARTTAGVTWTTANASMGIAFHLTVT